MMPPARLSRLLSVGSILADIRIELPHLPTRGGDVVASAVSISTGGAFNVLAAATRNGLPSAFGGQHGTGPYGERIRADLQREGIATLFPPRTGGDSGFCIVMVEPDGERTFVTSPGVEAEIGHRELAELAPPPSDALFVSGYDLAYPALGGEIVRWIAALSADLFLVLDPGPLVAEIPAERLSAALSRVAILTLNRREAALLASRQDADDIAASILQRLSPGALLILRDGAAGCTLFGARLPEAPLRIAAPQVRMIDSTGAGDTHTGVLLAAIAAGLDPAAAAARANAAAALSVTRRGPATAPRAEELDAFLATQPAEHRYEASRKPENQQEGGVKP